MLCRYTVTGPSFTVTWQQNGHLIFGSSERSFNISSPWQWNLKPQQKHDKWPCECHYGNLTEISASLITAGVTQQSSLIVILLPRAWYCANNKEKTLKKTYNLSGTTVAIFLRQLKGENYVFALWGSCIHKMTWAGNPSCQASTYAKLGQTTGVWTKPKSAMGKNNSGSSWSG